MAGGLGKRMNSDLPKVLHNFGKKPMLIKIVHKAMLLDPLKIFIVVGKYRTIIEETLRQYFSLDKIEFIIQPEALGTGHAIQCCRDELLKYTDTNVVILSGDTPLLKAATIRDIMHDFNKVKIVTTQMKTPYGYGRIIEKDGVFDKIVEEKDCTLEERLIEKVNCGVYAFESDVLCKYLSLLQNKNAQSEYYLTDIIELIKVGENIQVDLYDIPEDRQMEIMGVNTIEQLQDLEERQLKDVAIQQ
jgi:UDP-N-acetylglucosamine diphosphorylase/glucosamine-1-phosphate N-acetyltransferase